MAKKKSLAQAKNIEELPESNSKGRPTKYKSEFCVQVLKLCILGLTDKQLADFFEISESTLNEWKLKYPEFSESIKKGKDVADSNVAASLYQRAVGYTHDEEKIFLHEGKPVRVKTKKHYAPDATSAIFFLKNRQPKLWRDTKVLQGDADAPLPLTWIEEKTYESPKEDEK